MKICMIKTTSNTLRRHQYQQWEATLVNNKVLVVTRDLRRFYRGSTHHPISIDKQKSFSYIDCNTALRRLLQMVAYRKKSNYIKVNSSLVNW